MAKYGRLETWDFVAVAVYFALVIGVGIYSILRAKRGTVGGYFLAGRFMTWLPVGASIFASNIGSEHFIGLAGSGAAAGVAVGGFELNACVYLQILGWIFMPVYIASGVCTLPEYMKKRFGGRRIQVYLAVLSLAMYILTKISVNLYSGALFIQEALHWNMYVSIFLLLAITALTAITGGLTAVMYTDTLQTFVMVLGSVALTIISFIKVGGYTELLHQYPQAIAKPLNWTLVNSTLILANKSTCGIPRADSWVMLRDPVNSDLPWPGFIFGQTFASIWYWCADQMMVQRALSSKSLSHAQGGTLFAGYLKLLPFFVVVLPGMISRVLYTDEVACADEASCMLACGNPVGCSNIAYPKLVLELMPQGLRGIMLSVMLAALMSDLTSIFNSASTLFTMDIYRFFRRQSGTKELMIVGRLSVCLMVVVGILWIPIIQNMQGAQLFIYIQAVSAYLAPPIAVVYLLAVLWKRCNEKGAFISLMVGMVVGVIRMVLEFVYREPRCGDVDTRPVILRVHFLYFALILATLTALTAILVSLMTEPPTDKQVTGTTFFSRYDKMYLETSSTPAADLKDVEKLTESGHATTESESAVPTVSTTVDREREKNGDAVLLSHSYDESRGEVDMNATSISSNSEVVQYKNGEVAITKKPNAEKDPGSKPANKRPALFFFLKYFCGLEEAQETIKQSAEMDTHMANLTSLRQNGRAKIGLWVGLGILFAVDLFVFMFFTFGSNMFGLIK